MTTFRFPTWYQHPITRLLILVSIVLLLIVSCQQGPSTPNATPSPIPTENPIQDERQETATNNQRPEVSNDRPAPQEARANFGEKDLRFEDQVVAVTYHARCRMDCRFIDAYEVQEVINQGNINERKTKRNPPAGKCPSIAYEGTTADGQRARIIVGDCDDKPIIITVIDLGEDHQCSCK